MDKRFDFKKVEEKFEELPARGKTTLLYRLLQHGGPMIWRTVIKYCTQFLDKHNKKLDPDDPIAKKYLNYGKHRKK